MDAAQADATTTGTSDGSSASAADAMASDGASADGADATLFGGNWAGDAGWGTDADFPYYPSNYDEPHRAQYHYTAPNGWINDVNGVWYYGGVYHLTTQAYPFTLAQGPKHWGHAISTDLIHWATAPIALDPGVNVPGDAWSGSTVVDVDNASGLQTGTAPVLVTVYTATSKGPCLAYSNDFGRTWQAYDQNPVNIVGGDPHVFWHEPTHRWVCATASVGNTTFYTSTDLKMWSKASSVAFGLDCPDIYELPVDGVATNTKWVLQQGSGEYLIGQFDGQTFTPDPGGPYAIDYGLGFYASQAFYRRTFPDARVVQMAWINSNDHVDPVTGPWNQAISFPVELRLKTEPQGVRVTRTPIAEIAGLYGATQHWSQQVLAQGHNLLAGLESKTFDLELVVNVTNSAAAAIQFQLANESFSYDITHQAFAGTTLETLSGASISLAPESGQVTFRILADWSQLELFGNNGEVSYTRSIGFTPADSSLSITADGPLSIVSADFRQLNRAWPGRAALSSAQLDDADPSTTYSVVSGGQPSVVTDDGAYLASTCHVLDGAGSFVQATVTGTRVEWHGLKNVDLGKVDISLDGQVVATNVDCYDPIRQIATLYSARGLTNGPHTLVVSANGTKNPASAGTAFVHDFFASYVDP
jgi:fructan beta-fructosidase